MTAGALVVWCAPDPGASLHPLVPQDALARAARFRLPIDAHRHLTGRVLARRAAARRLQVDPVGVVVDVQPDGAPVLRGPNGALRDVHVSITHAGDHVGVAVADTPVGLDVQDVAALAEVWDSRDLWTHDELADLRRADPVQRLGLAAQWWTAKEAVLKSRGRGLLDPLDTLDARAAPVTWHGLALDDAHRAAIAGAVPTRITRISGVYDALAS